MAQSVLTLDSDIEISILSKVVEYACCESRPQLKGFSRLMTDVWSDDCGIMKESTVNHIKLTLE